MLGVGEYLWRLVPAKRLAPLLEETNELIAIFAASVKTAKKKRSY